MLVAAFHPFKRLTLGGTKDLIKKHKEGTSYLSLVKETTLLRKLFYSGSDL